MSQAKPIVILGAGGHAKMVYELAGLLNLKVEGIVNPEQPTGLLAQLNWLGNDEQFSQVDPSTLALVNAIGSTHQPKQRQAVFDFYHTKGFSFASLIHPSSVISVVNVTYGAGFQAMPLAAVNTHCRIGNNVLLNTYAVIEHDCEVGDHCHIASGAVICGGCKIGHGVHIGAGATINQGLSIGSGAVIASGSVVIEDVSPNSLVAGVPAQQKRAHAV